MFETEHLILRPLNQGDFAGLYALYGDPEMMRYITGEARTAEKTAVRLQAHIADHEQYGFGLCAAILKSSGAMIGRCGAEPRLRETGLEGDLAWMFKRPFWGQGLATEFGIGMIAYAKANLSPIRLFATADPANAASIQVMHKLNMSFVKEDAYEVEYELLLPVGDITG